MKPNVTKSSLYEHVARIGKALSSPKRLELIELLAQGEKTVDTLAQQALHFRRESDPQMAVPPQKLLPGQK